MLTCGSGVRQAVAIGRGKHYKQAAGSYVDGWVSYQEPLRGVGKVGSDVDGWFFGSVTVEADVICYVRFTKYVYLRSLRVRIVVCLKWHGAFLLGWLRGVRCFFAVWRGAGW